MKGSKNKSALRAEDFERTREIEIFGKVVKVKNYICSENGGPYKLKPEHVKLQLSLSPVSYCPAKCPFCVAKGTKDFAEYDLDRLRYVLRSLKEKDLVRGVNITGGEPFMNVSLLNDSINSVYEILGEDLEVSVNTNGMHLRDVSKIDKLELMESIHISRHHYDDSINNSIFGIDLPSGEEIKKIVNDVGMEDLFVFNCLLLKGYIDSSSKVKKFLEFTSDVDVWKAGFISCIDVNDYTRKHRVTFDEVFPKDDPGFLYTRNYCDFEYCKCQDGAYATDKGKLVRFYGRTTTPDDCEYLRGFFLGSDNHVKCGYSDEIII